MSRRSKAGRTPSRLKAPRSPEILGKGHAHKSTADYKRSKYGVGQSDLLSEDDPSGRTSGNSRSINEGID